MMTGLALVTWADPEESFKKGIAALDLEKWQESASHLRAAVAENPRESENRVFLSGVFSRPYLPHYYLGWALFNSGLQDCTEALKAFEASERQGLIKSFKRQYQNLQTARDRCNEAVLPDALAAAHGELERATRLGEGLTEPLADADLERDRVAGLDKLTEARAALESGQDGSRLSDLQAAERVAGEAAALFTKVASRSSAATSERLAVAMAGARSAIEEAVGARQDLSRLLADPGRSAAWSEQADLVMPADGVARLESARSKLRNDSSLAEIEQAQADAKVAISSFERMRERAEQATTRYVEGLERQAALGATGGSPRLPVQVAPEIRPARETRPTTLNSAQRKLVNEILRLRTIGSRLLGVLGTEETASELLETQKSRLTLLILEARERRTTEDAEGLETLRSRLASSLAALQLIAGARAFLAGDALQTIEILDDTEQTDVQLVAQAHLFVAAALHTLYLVGGEVDDSLGMRASSAVRECRALAQDLTPDPRVFSPLFRAFFQQVVNSGAS